MSGALDVIGRPKTVQGKPVPGGTAAGLVPVSDGVGGFTWTSAATAGLAAKPTLVTSLPTSPTDGQEVYYLAESVSGVVWHLRYRAAATGPYKWEYVGGSPLYANVFANEGGGSGTANVWSNLATVGPSVVAPLAGDYRARFGSMWNAQSTSSAGKVGIAKGDTDPVLPIAMGVHTNYGNASDTAEMMLLAEAVVPGVGVGVAMRLRYNRQSTTTSFNERWLSVHPVRVG